jgi:transcriptional regulator with XRE-family HTH domain
VRQLVAREAQARGIEVGALDEPPAPRRRRKVTPECSPEVVRAALRKRTEQQPGLAARLARRLGVSPAQVSRFKGGYDRFPAAKLDRLFALLHEPGKPTRRRPA